MEFNIVRNLKMREIGIKKFGLQHVMLSNLCQLDTFGAIIRDYDNPSYACKFCLRDDTNFFALAFEDGGLHFTKVVDPTQPISSHSLKVHYNAIYDVCWIPGELLLLTASGDEKTVLIDVSGPAAIIQNVFQSHTSSVRRVTACPGSPNIFATCGRDGNIAVWDTRLPRPQDKIVGAHRASRNFRTHSVLDLKYIDGNRLISCGNADNSIKIWDMRRTHSINKKRAVHSFCLKNPTANKVFMDITLDVNGEQFYATSSCNRIYIYKYHNTVCDGWFEGASLNSDFVRTCMSPDGEYLASGSLDGNAYIWPARRNNQEPVRPLARLVGHTQAVTAIAWASFRKSPVIVTCSDDNTEVLWGLPSRDKDWNEMNQSGFVKMMSYPKKAPKSFEKIVLTEPKVSQPREHTHGKLPTVEEHSSPLCTLSDQCASSGSLSVAGDCNGNRRDPKLAPFLENLPNFVVDGLSPHNLASPIPPTHKENIDWLTQHRKNSASGEKNLLNSSGKKRLGISNSGKKRKGKSLLQYFPKISKSDNAGL